MLPAGSPIAAHLRRALEGESLTEEVTFRGVIYESHYMPQRDLTGRVIGVTIFSMDITQRRQAENALSESEARFRASIENMLDPFVIWSAVRDPDGKIIDFTCAYANASCRAALQQCLEEIQGKRLLDLLPIHKINGLFERYCQVVETGVPLVLDGFDYAGPLTANEKSILIDIRAVQVDDGVVVNWRNQTDHLRNQAEMTELQRHLIEHAEKERRQLARLLHDGPVQDLYAIDFQLHSIEWQASTGETRAALGGIQSQLHQVIDTLLGTVGHLRPFSLSPFGLKAAILSQLDRFTAAHPEIEVVVALDDDQDILSQPARLGLYRAYQHAINNIERHACATRIAVTLKVDACQVILRIEDNGCGFAVPDRLVTLVRDGHLGIASASDQIARLGGQFEIQSEPGKGTVVMAVVGI